MKMFNRIAIATALLVPAAAAPASAQSWKWDLGGAIGYNLYTNSITSDSLRGTTGGGTGTQEQVKIKNGLRYTGKLGYWFTEKFGLRANYSYQNTEIDGEESDVSFYDNVNMHNGSGDLVFRFKAPNESWMGSEVLPYLALGLGAKWANGQNDPQICRDGTENPPKEWNCSVFQPTATSGLVALAEDKTIMGLAALGADVRISPRLAITLEANDRIFRPPFARAAATTTANTFSMPNGDQRISKLTHEFGADIGIKLLFGLAQPPMVADMPPPPAPMPPPPPAPMPPPAPRVENIQVCVIDPTQPNGLRMQNAMYMPASGDTMVMLNGNQVRLSSTVGNVMVVRNADWYVRGEPLTITVGKERMQYGTEAGAQMIESSRLSYLGMVNGYPVYADRDEVADINNALADLRRANASRDLGDILDERKDLRGELDDVKRLYVPLQSTGCVFQTFQMIEQVRKGK